jgi:GntR family transcriptional regulator / MocR family aminotransferase
MRSGIVELPLATRRDSQVPLGTQIVGQLRKALAEGRLAAGERLPASRALAAELGVSRTVINAVYAQLFAEGWIEGRHGSGTYVAEGAAADRATGAPPITAVQPGAAGPDQAEPAAGHLIAGRYSPIVSPTGSTPIDLRPGIPWTAGIDRAAWRRAWRTAGLQPPATADPAGLPGLRAALTGYLRRSRGIQCHPEEILVTRGIAGGLSLIAAALLRPGDRVGVEEPGYPVARDVLATHGAQVVPCPADADGLVVSELPAGLKLIYTTPSHQYPLGGRLPVPRRRALIGWARANGAFIAEDDYDGEFRYDVAPLPALYGLDPEMVIYLGTTTKTFTPAVRVGWLAASPELITRLAATADRLDAGPASPAQQAVLTLITSGDLERHIRRLRHEYTRRRAALAAAFADGEAGNLLGDQAGFHVVLQTRHDARAAATAARERGVEVGTLARFYCGPVTSSGLVIGYGGAPLAQVARGGAVLHEILTRQGAPIPGISPDHLASARRHRNNPRKPGDV